MANQTGFVVPSPTRARPRKIVGREEPEFNAELGKWGKAKRIKIYTGDRKALRV